MATAEQHDVIIRWQQQNQGAVQGEVNKIKSSFAGIGASITKPLASMQATFKKSLASMSTAAKQAGAVMSVGITAPLVAMAKQSIDAASDLNESMSAVKTVFGDSADEVLNFSRTAATNLGQSQNAALSMASALGALFQSIGLNNQQMADFTMHLETASADLGSFFNADPSQVLSALKSGLVGEAEPLRRFGILLNEAAVEAEGVKMGLIAAGDEMTYQQKVMARYSLIMSQIGAAQGDFARTSDGLANSQRILSSEIQDLQADIGSLLLPAMKDWVTLLKNAVGWVRNLSPEAKDLAVKIGLIAAAAGPVLAVLGTVGPVLAALASGPFVVAAGAAVALYQAWSSNFLGIRDTVTKVIDRVGEYIGRVVEFFQHAKDRGLDPFRLAFRTLIVTLGEQLGAGNPAVEFLQGIYRNARKLVDWLQTTDFSGAISTFFTALTGGDMGDQWTPVLEDIKGGWDKTIGAWLGEQVDKGKAFAATLLSGMLEGFKGLNWDLVKNEFATGFGDFKTTVIDPAVAQLSPFAQAAVDAIVASAKAQDWQAIGDEVGTQLRASLGALDQFSEWIFNAITGASGGGVSPGLGGGGLAGGALPSQLGAWVREQVQQTDWESVHAEVNKGMASGNFIADFVGWANQQGIDLHTQIASYVNTELPLIDWQTAKDLLTTNGEDLLGQILQGFGNKMADISAWFSGGTGGSGGEAQSFGARISGMVAGAIAQFKDEITGSGAAVLGWFIDGLNAKWTELQQWFTDHNPGSLVPSGWFNINGGSSDQPAAPPPERHGAGGGSRGTEDPALARAYGGLGDGWTWVGERGRELVKLARGSLVIPHGASETRAMAMGGVVGLTRDDLRGSVRGLSPKELAKLIAYMKSYGGDDTPHKLVDRARHLEGRFFGGANITDANAAHFAAQGFSRHGSGQRNAFDDASWRHSDRRTALDNVSDDSRSGGIHVYGNITIHPPNADVAGEISRQFQTKNR